MYVQNNDGATHSYDSSHVSVVTKVRGALLHYIATDSNLLTRLKTIVMSQLGPGTVDEYQDTYSVVIKLNDDDIRLIGFLPNENDRIIGHIRMVVYNSLKDFFYLNKDGYMAIRQFMETGSNMGVTEALRQTYEREYISALMCLGNIVDLGDHTYRICL